ncbi:MAG TPA: RNA polymerase sigma factor [Kofleriaceae bacterium]|nr:RNA polymerase sigma factor [Kofleriaceae bacterium]
MPFSFAISRDDVVPPAPPAAAAPPSLEARLSNGDPQAVDEAYRLHHAAIRGFARKLVGDDDVAEDLVHDTFLALPDAIRRFRGDASLRTFLTAIALRRGHKYIRSAGRRRAAFAKLADQPLPASRRPDDDLAREQLAVILYRALDKLPDDQRAAFVLCEIDQLSAAEAGVITGAPEATMRTRLFHARKKLRALLEKEVP